jgi:hypothetical protein
LISQRLLFFLLLFGCSFSTTAQRYRFWSDTSKNSRRISLPIIGFSPETRLSVGALGVALWKNIHPSLPTRTSNAELIVLYTTRQQLIFLPRYTIFTKGEKYLLEGMGQELVHYRDFYYGRGNNTPISNRDTILYDALGFENKIGRRIFKDRKLFIGVEVRAVQYYNVHRNAGRLLDAQKVTGYNGSSSIGFGPTLTWDNRDNILNPGRGFFWDMRFSTYSTAFGGTVNYHRLLIDFRKYLNVVPSKRHILAFEVTGSFVKGNAPFKELSELGGSRIMRGYYRGRFRDNYLTAVQAEYRMPVYKRVGVVAFAGLGKVYNPSEVNFDGLHYSYGGGIRVNVNKRERLNLRLDYARGDPHYLGYIYFGFAESF